MYAGILGGSLSNTGWGIAVDPNDNAYVTGETGAWINSPPTYTDFPLTAGAFDSNFGQCGWKGFITKINPSGTAIVYSSLLGGKGNCPQTSGDLGSEVAVNAAGEAFVVGTAGSVDFPTTPGAYDRTHNGAFGNSNSFVLRLNASGTGAIYSTFYGGNMGVTVCGIAINSSNEAYISGYTETDDGTFPITSCAYQSTFGGQSTANKRGDFFVAKFNASGSALLYSTFIGGNSDDYQIPKICLYGTCEDEVIVNGTSHSKNFPTTPPVFQPTKLNGTDDQPVVFKLKPKVTPNFTYTKPPCSLTVTFTDATTGNCIWQSGPWTPSTWTWHFGDGTTSSQQNPVHTYSALGTYSVTLVVSCPKDSITLPITVSNSSQPVSGNTTLCNGASTVLSAGTGTSYSWNTGASTSSISVSPTTTTSYSVVVDNGACKDTIFMNVVIGVSPGLTYTVTPVLCNGNKDGAASVTPTGGNSPYNYSWNTGQTTATITGLLPGTYSITISDASGCSSTQTLSVTEPAALSTTVTPNGATCAGNNGNATVAATGGTGAYSYSWNPSAGSTATVSGLAAGNYTVTVTDVNSCSKASTFTITQASALIASVSSTPASCGGNSGTATISSSTGTGPYTYTWSNGQVSQTATNLLPGTYSATITDAAGCSSVNTVSVASTPSLTATSTNATICAGQNASLTALGGTNYIWSEGSSTQTINVSPVTNTSYSVIVSSGTCKDTAYSTVTVYAAPSVTAYSSATITAGTSVTLSATGGNSYVWSTGETTTDIIVAPVVSTPYCVSSGTGICADTSCVTIFIKPIEPIDCSTVSSEDAFALPSAFSPNADGQNDRWKLLYAPLLADCIVEFQIAVYNRWGEKVFEGTKITFSWDGTYNGKPEETAVFGYYLTGTLQDGTKVKKKGNVSLLR